MSPSTPITPQQSPAPNGNGNGNDNGSMYPRGPKLSLYTGPTVHIAIGPSEYGFYVHVNALSVTKYFALHGPPLTAEQKAARAEAAPEQPEGHLDSQAAIKKEDPGGPARSRSPTVAPENLSAAPAFSAADIFGLSTPDYYLRGTIYDRAAFELIVNWLYNDYPDVPGNRREYRTLLKAYLLALKYEISPLQDCIIECLRRYHQEFNITFDDFSWLIRRLDDTPETHTTPLVMYLADQIAWEIVSLGYVGFTEANRSFNDYMQKDYHPCRIVLFKALANIARSTNPYDPATGDNRWKIADRPKADEVSPVTDTVDMVDIDSD